MLVSVINEVKKKRKTECFSDFFSFHNFSKVLSKLTEFVSLLDMLERDLLVGSCRGHSYIDMERGQS